MYTKIVKNLQNLKVIFISFLYYAQRISQTIYYKLVDTLGSLLRVQRVFNYNILFIYHKSHRYIQGGAIK